MDTSTATTLASIIVTLITPYLKTIANEMLKKTGEKVVDIALEKTKKLYEVIQNKLSAKPAANEIFDELAEFPDDEDLQASLRVQLKKILLADTEFAKEVADILQDALDAGANKLFQVNIQGDHQRVTQISNPTIYAEKDFIGQDKIEIHANHFNWNGFREVNADDGWMMDGLNWLRNSYNVNKYPEWEQYAKTLSTESLYKEGRLLTEKREYTKAVAFWAELRSREPRNIENESYLRLCLSKVERDIRIRDAIDTFMSQAQSCAVLERYDEAIALLKKVLILSPNNLRALEYLEHLEDIKSAKRWGNNNLD